MSSFGDSATFSLMTYNLWKTDGIPTYWEKRRGVLLRQLKKLNPDIMVVQELHPDIMECILEALPGHKYIQSKEGTEPFPGYTDEGNIFYRDSMFKEVDSGYEDIQQEEEYRRLFWIRLKFICNGKTALFTNAHQKEIDTDLNLRKIQARLTINKLNAMQLDNEPCFFGGDLNESFWPKELLNYAGFVDCFSSLSLPCRPTHPNRPTLSLEDTLADQALDWLFVRPGRNCSSDSVKSLVGTVVRDMVGLSSNDPQEKITMCIQPSDHCPVLAVYRVE